MMSKPMAQTDNTARGDMMTSAERERAFERIECRITGGRFDFTEQERSDLLDAIRASNREPLPDLWSPSIFDYHDAHYDPAFRVRVDASWDDECAALAAECGEDDIDEEDDDD